MNRLTGHHTLHYSYVARSINRQPNRQIKKPQRFHLANGQAELPPE